MGVICACLPRVYMLASHIYRHFVPKPINMSPPTLPHLTTITTSTINPTKASHARGSACEKPSMLQKLDSLFTDKKIFFRFIHVHEMDSHEDRHSSCRTDDTQV